jgi:mRNA interferase HigB
MLIRGQLAIDQFCRRYSTARRPLDRWVVVVRQATWSNFSDVRRSFAGTDLVGPYVVFNIGGNKFRLIARVDYEQSVVLVREVLTHAEYDRGRWKRS